MIEAISRPKQTKARKEHKCDFCNEKIIVGESYEKSTLAYDGHVYDWKTHNHCSKLANRLKMYEDADEGVTMDIFMETVSEKHSDILINLIPDEDIRKYSDIIQQLRKVRFKDKLWFVIRHFNKLDKELKEQTA